MTDVVHNISTLVNVKLVAYCNASRTINYSSSVRATSTSTMAYQHYKQQEKSNLTSGFLLALNQYTDKVIAY